MSHNEATFSPWEAALLATQGLLADIGGRGLIIGGVAVSLLSEPRLTRDVDAMFIVESDSVPGLISAAALRGLVPRLPDAAEFATANRVLLLTHTESRTDVDISLGALPFEIEAVERGVQIREGGIVVSLPTPEDLIIMKAVAHRPKDMLDIRSVISSHPGLDRERIGDG